MKTLIEIDAMGKPCPLPLLLFKKQLKLNSGTPRHYLLRSSDPHSEIDIGRYCEIHDYTYNFNKISEQEFHYYIET